MQFPVKTLIAAIDDALAAHDAEQVRYDAELEAWKKQQLEDWLYKHSLQWHAAAKEILVAVRRGRPITAKMLPQKSDGYGERLEFWSEPTGRGTVKAQIVYPVGMLRSLRSLLEAVTDESVSHSALERVGYRDLTGIFNAAAKKAGSL